jgi:hypothetical protein
MIHDARAEAAKQAAQQIGVRHTTQYGFMREVSLCRLQALLDSEQVVFGGIEQD